MEIHTRLLLGGGQIISRENELLLLAYRTAGFRQKYNLEGA